jgi:tetratricopeptide (TPR) repeat protein
MRKRSERHSQPALAKQAGGSVPADSRNRRFPPRRGFRLALAFLSPFLVLSGIELGLRLVGYGYSTDFFQPTRDGAGYTFNEHFRRQYYPRQPTVRGHPFRIPTPKPPNTIRLFVLGESAALGTPNPSFGFARILQMMLREQYPRRHFQVVNAAMRGINSHIIRDIAADCARHEPDLFLIYAGNNEVVGFRAPEPGSSPLAQNLTLVRATQVIRRTRLAQLIEAGLQRLRPGPSAKQDMAFFRRHALALDDPRRQAVYRNFGTNLADLCAALTATGTPVLLSTVPVNLRDCPPLVSSHRASLTESEKSEWEGFYRQGLAAESAGRWLEAVEFYEQAARRDDHFADLHFALGRCLLALNRREDARRHFGLARDWDALQFRADERINTLIRETAEAFRARGVHFVDAETALAASPLSEDGLPGDRLFQDHVHPRFEGDYLLARTFRDAVVAALGSVLGEPSAPLPSREACAAALAFTPWDELDVRAAAVAQLARPPFLDQLGHEERVRRLRQELKTREDRFQSRGLQAELEIYRQALERTPDDWELHHNLGMLLTTLGKYDAAIGHLEVEVRSFPELAWCRIPISQALAKAGRFGEAEHHLQEALRIDPGFAPAQEMLAAIGRLRRK